MTTDYQLLTSGDAPDPQLAKGFRRDYLKALELKPPEALVQYQLKHQGRYQPEALELYLPELPEHYTGNNCSASKQRFQLLLIKVDTIGASKEQATHFCCKHSRCF